MFDELIGIGPNLSPFQMCIRAAIIFVLALILIRIAGIRAFGMKSAFDNIIILLLGAVLSRPIYDGSVSYPGILAACLVLVLMHRFSALLSVYSDRFGRLMKGDKVLLYKDGKRLVKNMAAGLISHKDLEEGIRLQGLSLIHI